MAVVPAAKSAAQSQCLAAEAATAEQARALADECNSRIEVLDERSAWETSFVTADGQSILEIDLVPQRTDVNGAWEPIDTAIQPSGQKGGMLEVVAPIVDVQISNGDSTGVQPLGVITAAGQTIKVWFPLELPVPVLDGDRATYTLAPGVRMVTHINADGSGFTPVVELADPKAAEWFRNALSKERAVRGLAGVGFDIPLMIETSDGLTTSVREGGVVEVVDAAQNVVFQAPPSFMWDSAGAVPVDPALPREPDAKRTEAVRDEWALPGDTVAQMAVKVDESALVISPDSAMLSSKDTTWPVFIDPGISAHLRSDWIMLRTGDYTTSVPKFTETGPGYPGGGVGRCVGSECNVGYYISRLVWQFTGLSTIASLAGTDITSATFRVYGISSYTCTPAKTDLYHTAEIHAGSNWGNMPFESGQTSETSAHRPGCAAGASWRELARIQHYESHEVDCRSKCGAGDDRVTSSGRKLDGRVEAFRQRREDSGELQPGAEPADEREADQPGRSMRYRSCETFHQLHQPHHFRNRLRSRWWLGRPVLPGLQRGYRRRGLG